MFKPIFTISPSLAATLMKLERLRQEISALNITPYVLASLRDSSRLQSTHFSTKIEGNRLSQEEVIDVVKHGKSFPQRERDEAEVLGFYNALHAAEDFIAHNVSLSEQAIKKLHGLVMGRGKKNAQGTSYRDGQNVIRDSISGSMVYLPPEAHDVEPLMRELIMWLQSSEQEALPAPLRAGIAHYQFATIHPYYDGNGRVGRLLTTWMLHQSGFGLNGIYSLEEYYAKNLSSYYESLTIGPSHNYYSGRAEADITPWITYFCEGMLESFEHVKAHAENELAKSLKKSSQSLKHLNASQRKILSFFTQKEQLTVPDVCRLFHISQRTARNWVQQWVKESLLVVENPSKKKRSYTLAPHLQKLL